MSKKILLIIIFLCTCVSDEACIGKLEHSNIKQLSNHRVNNHLRHSFDIYNKIDDRDLYIIPRYGGNLTKHQEALIKEKFLMLNIEETEFPPSLIKKGTNPIYDKLSADLYNKARVTILISPKEMKVWRLQLWPVGIVGYSIENIEEISLTKKQRKKLEKFREPEFRKYWW